MPDRYTKFILTVIAAALVYLCIVLTPLPGVHAQVPSLRPGEPSGPTEVVISGWRTPAGLAAFPVSIQHPVQLSTAQPLRVTGSVVTERSSGAADRVIVVGWEDAATREKPATFRPFTDKAALPVRTVQ